MLPSPRDGAEEAAQAGPLARVRLLDERYPPLEVRRYMTGIVGTHRRAESLNAIAQVLLAEDHAEHALAVLAGLGSAQLLLRHCVRRFGGVTGDVFGGLAETAATAALVTLTLGA